MKPKPRNYPIIVPPALPGTPTQWKVLHWRKEQGNAVKAGETLLDMENDFCLVEIKSQTTGFLNRILATPGSVVLIGDTIGIIGSTAEPNLLDATVWPPPIAHPSDLEGGN